MGKLRIGVFGGYRGMAMIEVLLHHPDAELVAVCDKYRPILDDAKKKAAECGTELAVFESFDDFIEYDMDAVVLANYAHEHGIFAVKCLNKGKHVLSEVLPCETLAQAVELIETVEKTGLVYAYAENYCYRKDAFEMWRRYKNGDIGEVMYGEGEYIHDCSGCWPQITYGERNHWRNMEYSTFYCTHSLGPLFMMTGLRPESVVGFEVKPHEEDCLSVGNYRGPGIIIATMENGAVFKSINGWLKREPGSVNYELYGKKGSMETNRFGETPQLSVYKEGAERCVGSWEKYDPDYVVAKEEAQNYSGHGGGDFYPTHCFIEKILGRPDGDWSIDVYQAIDMGICGILAYRSILSGNNSVKIPNFRNKEERDLYRNDNACTNPEIAGDSLLPRSSYGEPYIPDSVFEEMRRKWQAGEKA